MFGWLSSKIPGITDLTHDFVDGCNLVRLYEACTGQGFPFQWRLSPRTVHENRQNIGLIVTVLENTRCLRRGVISKEDLLWGDIRTTYALLRRMNISLDHGNLPPLIFHQKDPEEPQSPKVEHEWYGKMVRLAEDEFPVTKVLEEFQRPRVEEEEKVERIVEEVEESPINDVRCEEEIEEKSIIDDTQSASDKSSPSDEKIKDEVVPIPIGNILPNSVSVRSKQFVRASVQQGMGSAFPALKPETFVLLREPERPLLRVKQPERPLVVVKEPERPLVVVKEPERTFIVMKEPEHPLVVVKEPERPLIVMEEPERPLVFVQEPERPSSPSKSRSSSQTERTSDSGLPPVERQSSSPLSQKSRHSSQLMDSPTNELEESLTSSSSSGCCPICHFPELPNDETHRRSPRLSSIRIRCEAISQTDSLATHPLDSHHLSPSRWLSEPSQRSSWSVSDHPTHDHGFISTGDITAPIRPVDLRHLPKSNQAVGIDLGTQFCRYSIYSDSQVSDKEDILQSVITFHDDKRTIGMIPVGVADRDDAVIVKNVKRLLGRDLEGESGFHDQPFEFDAGTGRSIVRVAEQEYSTEELAGMVFSTVRDRASAMIGENIVDAVVGLPGFCAHAQRQATIDAGRIAGLNILRIVSEPAAVAVAFNARNPSSEPRNIVVFDLGAGKLDASLIRLEGGLCTVVKTSGNAHLGGSDIDELLFQHFADDLGGLRESKAACRKCRDDCEAAKIALSSHGATRLLGRELTRDAFERLCEQFFARCMEPLADLFSASDVRKAEIAKVLLVGGSTRIPKLRQLIAEFFGDGVELFDAEANNIGVVDGAAMQGAVMKGTLTGIAIRNSTPLSLGISLANGTNHVLLPRGSVLPTRCFTKATTFHDNQPNVGFDIVQGERPLARDCIKLGHVTCEGIEREKSGVPRIMVEMMLDEDGILFVTASDLRTGVSVSARVENRGNLFRDCVERLLAEAEEERVRDPNLRAREEAKFNLAVLLHRAKLGFKGEMKKRRMPAADQEKYRRAIVTCKKWLTAHPSEKPIVYNDKYDYLQKLLNEVVIVI